MRRRSTISPNEKRRRSVERFLAAQDARAYDPSVEGLGNEFEWQRMFNSAMGFEEATKFRDEQRRRGRTWDEYSIIAELAGVHLEESSMWSEIKSAFRKAAMNCHPDRVKTHGMNATVAEDNFKRVNAAYAILAHKYGESYQTRL